MADRSTRGVTSEIRGLADDSSTEAERLQVSLWRSMSPARKAQAVGSLCRATQELSLAGIRHRYPHASERECLLRLTALKLGPDLMRVVYPGSASLLRT